MRKFIITQWNNNHHLFVCAPTGYYRSLDGKIVRDGTPSPEWTARRDHAYEFASHRSAMRVRNVCGDDTKVAEVGN
jgi:hypothetical protein